MHKCFHRLLDTDHGFDAMILRLGLGIMIFPHGLQKTIGLFGGSGFNGTMQFFTETMGIPAFFAFLAILAESLGGLALLLGALTRVAAFGVGVTMTVALMVHWNNGFFMNWMGQKSGEGFEFHIMAIAMAIALIIRGSGCMGLDLLVQKFCCKK